jgi:hypothetical protein
MFNKHRTNKTAARQSIGSRPILVGEAADLAPGSPGGLKVQVKPRIELLNSRITDNRRGSAPLRRSPWEVGTDCQAIATDTHAKLLPFIRRTIPQAGPAAECARRSSVPA